MLEDVYKRNRKKKVMKCLKCGKPIRTTLVHRLCRRCTKRNYEVTPVTRYPMLQGTDFRSNEYEIE